MTLEEYHEVLNKIDEKSRAYVESQGLLFAGNSNSFYQSRQYTYALSDEEFVRNIHLAVPFYQFINIINSLENQRKEIEYKKFNIMFPTDGMPDSKIFKQLQEEETITNQKLESALESFEKISKVKIGGQEITRHIALFKGTLAANKIVNSVLGKYVPPIRDYSNNPSTEIFSIYEGYQERLNNLNYEHPRSPVKLFEYAKYLRTRDLNGHRYYGLIKDFEKEYKGDLILTNPNYTRHKSKFDVSRYRALTQLLSDLPVKDKEINDLKANIQRRNDVER